MSAGATDPNEAVTRAEHTHDGYLVDEVDRVDLSGLRLDDDDDDDWLYVPPQCSTESAIKDLYAWLKAEPELDVRNNKKCIDTRTFTRPKKRSARMSFESIFEGLPPSTMDVRKLQDMNVAHIENVEKYLPAIIGNKESVPPILRPSIRTAMSILSDENSVTSGQESMEAFLNMSQSKGIDSFINLGEPEFNDLLMNVSQPSILSASVIASLSESTFIKSDTMLETSKITARSSNDTEGSSNSDNINNETFVMRTADNTITSDKSHCTNSLSDTCKEFPQPSNGLNETYNAGASSGTSARSSLDRGEAATLSSTFVTEPNADATFVQLQNQASNDVKQLNIIYLSSTRGAERPRSPVSIASGTYVPTMRVNKADLNVTCNVLSDDIESVVPLTRETLASALDMSFKVPVCNQSTPMNPSLQTATSKFAARHLEAQPAARPALKAPTTLRRELLAEVQRSGKLDSTYNHIPSGHLGPRGDDAKENVRVACDENETDVSPTNKFRTYRKTPAFTATANQGTSQNETVVIAQRELPVDQRKFYTFTKRSNAIGRLPDNTAGENVERTRPSVNSTFCKPHLPQVLQKRNVPTRTLTKLPQFLQKSNPNLASSSLKSGVVSVSRTGISSVGYIKGSQPNLVERSPPSKLHPYGKAKSGSDQRLLEANASTNNQFPMKGAIAGSTESIESSHSVHSAPDLDDRLSTCSDSSSHNSCTKQTMNIDQLHKLVRMQEESLKHDSAPKPNRQVLQNTWVEAKMDLPSPISKNGGEYSEIDKHLPNVDLSMKCSSPLISPTGSSHALNNDGNAEGNVTKTKDEIVAVEKMEDPNQVVPKIENKTRLRQPTNWSIGSKPAVISGIPRPASRIPALRFVRPNAKTTQADLRKGCT